VLEGTSLKVAINGEDAFEYPDEFEDLLRKFLTELEVLTDGQ